MSAETVGWAFAYSPFDGATFACHLAIADSVNADHGYEFFMSVPNLAKKARCGRSTATTALQKLVDAGLIQPLTSVAQARAANTTRRYLFIMPEGLDRVTAGPPTKPRALDLVQNLDKGIASDETSLSQPLDEPQPATGDDPKKNPRRTERSSDDLSDDSLAAEFEALWLSYPRRIEKAKALKAYRARRRAGAAADELLSATQSYARKCAADQTETIFIKHPATFFGPNEPWRDSLVEEPAAHLGQPFRDHGCKACSVFCGAEEYCAAHGPHDISWQCGHRVPSPDQSGVCPDEDCRARYDMPLLSLADES